MARKRASTKRSATKEPAAPSGRAGWPSSQLDTRIVYCSDCLDQLRKLPDGCVDLIYIDCARAASISHVPATLEQG